MEATGPRPDSAPPEPPAGAANDARRLERAVESIQQLEGLSLLAGGVAHELNNLLMGVLGGVRTLRAREPAMDPDARTALGQIEAAAERGAELTRELLIYSGRIASDPHAATDLSDLVAGGRRLVRAAIARTAELEFVLADALPPVETKAQPLLQILMILCTNASDALAGEPGQITVRTLPGAPCHGAPGAVRVGRPPEPPFVALEVRDTGCGMEPGVLGRAFEPFFSTRSGGRGLGLAAAAAIARKLGASIEAESEPGEGATFRVLLPATGRTDLAPGARRTAGSQPRILLAEDDSLVRASLAATLGRAGYQVLAAADGRQAVDRVQKEPGELSAAVIDLGLPGQSGLAVARALRALHPRLPIVITSGAPDPAASSLLRRGPTSFLLKPYRAERLVREIGALAERVRRTD